MDGEAKKMLEEILAAVKGLEGRVSKLETAGTSSASSTTGKRASAQKKLSLKEFIISQAPSNAVQTTLTIGYYLENHDGVSPFNASDLEEGFRAARETVPPNINDKANQCVKNGYFMVEKGKKDSKKAWVVTRTGEELVCKGFGKV
ncbi:MAG TPA: hypothetical protein VIJ04_17475 [Xanthobacteraceae bacterium]